MLILLWRHIYPNSSIGYVLGGSLVFLILDFLGDPGAPEFEEAPIFFKGFLQIFEGGPPNVLFYTFRGGGRETKTRYLTTS